MDGMYRICKALLEGLSDIEAVRFIHDPEPDYVGIHPDHLPYDNYPPSSSQPSLFLLLTHHDRRQIPMPPRRHHPQDKTNSRT